MAQTKVCISVPIISITLTVSLAIHAAGETTSHTTSKALRKVGLAHNSVAQSAGDDTLDAERKTFTREGEEVPGFTSSVVPTLEEKTVAEQRPPKEQTESTEDEPFRQQKTEEAKEGKPAPNGAALPNGGSPQPHTDDGTLFGAPANAMKSSQTDDEPPHAASENGDPDEEEQAAPEARATIRKQLDSGVWTLPTRKPEVHADGFEDPVSDTFWKNVWVASAAHNVCFGKIIPIHPLTKIRSQTEIYRKVFHAVPDDLITTWKQYKEFILHHEKLNKPVRICATYLSLATYSSISIIATGQYST